MKNYLILSSKIWNKDMFTSLQSDDHNSNWNFIDDKDEFNLEKINRINPAKIFIPHWSYIIPEEIYNSYECIVFHMTDLPFGRGGSPLQNLISRGFEDTKISALKVVKEIDAGDIYLKKDLNLNGTAEEIFIRTNKIIFQMIKEIINLNIIPEKQVGEVISFKRRTSDMSNVENVEDIETMFNHIRMLDAEGYPNAYIETKNFRLEFNRASLKADKQIIADVRIIQK
tara:strand:+ start:2262 stop:2942 length:681 start_codon:yes stop_codon:yes gene_type:complete